MKRERQLTHFTAVILIILLGLIVYADSLSGKFVWDDGILINDNPHIRSWVNIAKIFTESVKGGVKKESNFYRPVQILTYMADYSLWRFEAAGYHLTNILLHILAALAVYRLICILFNDILLSLLAAAFFVSHPIHTEVVTYISGRSDSLAALFMLLCLIFYVRDIRLKRAYIYPAALSSYVLALLSRENSLILPLLLLVYHYSFNERFSLKRFGPILLAIPAYLLARTAVLGPLLPASPYPGSTFLQRLPGMFVAIAEYTRLFLLPLNQHMEYGYALFSFLDPRAISGLLIILSLIICAVKMRRTDKVIPFSISWFLVALIPVSQIYPLNAYMAEHWLYLPSIGLFLLLARGLTVLYRNKRFQAAAVSIIVILLSFYSCLAIRQNDYWKDPVSFYEKTLKYAPDSYRIHYNLGIAYSSVGKYEEAVASYKKALTLNPTYEQAYYGLGNAYAAGGKREEAITAYKKCIEITPAYSPAYNNLGRISSDMGNVDEAIALYVKAVEVDPGCFNAYYNLGDEYRRLKRNKDAIASYEKALKIDPEDAATHNNLAVVYYYEKRYDLAIKHCDKAIKLGFGVNPEFLKVLGQYR